MIAQSATKTKEFLSPFRAGAKTKGPSFCGSSTQISDLSAAIIHHIEYMPPDSYRDGENYFELKSTWETPYKFNGKPACHCKGYEAAGREKDEETGLYYYGARYYVPEVCVWLSVDSMADKRPNQSPFMNCSGRPVTVIDPDGMDEWEVDKQTGEMKWEKESDKDIIYQTYKDKRTGIKSDEFNKHSIYAKSSDAKKKNNVPEFTDISFENKETGERVFDFLADNTDVEWGEINANDDLSGNDYISVHSSHDKSEDKRSTSIVLGVDFIKNNFLYSHKHSHPYDKMGRTSDDHFSSGDDRVFRDKVLKHFSTSKFYIRHGGGFEREYTNDTENYYGQ